MEKVVIVVHKFVYRVDKVLAIVVHTTKDHVRSMNSSFNVLVSMPSFTSG
jgi:hypothetical protein